MKTKKLSKIFFHFIRFFSVFVPDAFATDKKYTISATGNAQTKTAAITTAIPIQSPKTFGNYMPFIKTVSSRVFTRGFGML